jgi:3-oxoacyl-[acyl-carrier-protein] synthase II
MSNNGDLYRNSDVSRSGDLYYRQRVVITGLGCISPLGLDVSTTWRNIVTGKSGVGPITHFDASDFKTKIAAEVKGFDGVALFGAREVRRLDRFCQFAMAAARQAVADAGLVITDENRDRIGVLVGSGIGGMTTFYEQINIYFDRGPSRVSPFVVNMMIPDSAGGAIAIDMGVRGPNYAITAACATGAYSIGEAVETIRHGRADIMLAGGSEAVIMPITVAGLNVMTAISTRNDEPERASRPFDARRDGFVMGEGAGVMVLESLEYAQRRGARILAEITGFGANNDAFHITAPTENGEGSAACMVLALKDAQLAPSDIGYINAHGTSTILNDKSETAAIKIVFGEKAYQVPVSSTKSMVGHQLGAAGAVEAVFCVKVLQDNILPPTINYETPDPLCDLDYVPNTARPATVQHVMTNSFGFGGHNATLIISRFDRNNIEV